MPPEWKGQMYQAKQCHFFGGTHVGTCLGIHVQIDAAISPEHRKNQCHFFFFASAITHVVNLGTWLFWGHQLTWVQVGWFVHIEFWTLEISVATAFFSAVRDAN